MKTVLFLVGLVWFWAASAYAQGVATASGSGQIKYIQAKNKSYMTQVMRTEFEVRLLKIKLMDMNKKRHLQYGTPVVELSCENPLEVKKIIDRLINNHCQFLKDKELVYAKVKEALDKSVEFEKKFSEEIIDNDASVGANKKVVVKAEYKLILDKKVAIAKSIPSNMSPLDLRVPTRFVMSGFHTQLQDLLKTENQTATQSIAGDRYLSSGKVFPESNTTTQWKCQDIERSDGDSTISGIDLSLVCQSGRLTVKSRTHDQSYINNLVSCTQKSHSGNDIWKEVQPDKSVIFYACIDKMAAPLYKMEWDPKDCSTVGKGYGESWFAVSHYSEQPCTVGPNSTSFSQSIKATCANPPLIKRNVEVAWTCNSFGHIVPAQTMGNDSTFQMGTALVGHNVLWSVFYRLGDYAEEGEGKTCKLFDLKYRHIAMPSGVPVMQCNAPMAEGWLIYPDNQAQINDDHLPGVKCLGTVGSSNRSCYINCRTACDKIDDFGKANLVSMGANPQWLAPGTPIQNNYPDMILEENDFGATFFNNVELSPVKITHDYLP